MLTRYIKKYALEIFAVLVFLILLPLPVQINYLQNDEVTHFLSISNFLIGNFTLHPYILATFYSQGVLQALWIIIFGVRYMATATLVVSVITIYVFTKIVKQFFAASTFTSILMGMLLLINPIFLYSALGNMTENYFLFYFTISLYFFYSHIKTHRTKDFVLALVFAVLGFLSRQIGILIPLGYGIYLLTKKQYEKGASSLLVFAVITSWYFSIFSRTSQMVNSSDASFVNLLSPKNSYSLIVIALSYIGVFFLPLVAFLVASIKQFSKKQIFLFVFLVFISFFAFSKYFKPGLLIHRSVLADGRIIEQNNSIEFPYLGNTFGRTGFYPDNIGGTRYHYAGYFTLFKIFHYVGVVSAIFLIAYILFLLSTPKRTKLFTPEFILLVVNLGVILVLAKVYDRYLLPVFPVFILSVLSLRGADFSKLEKSLLCGFIALFIFLGYQYSMDFVLVNKFAWEKATNLVTQEVTPNKIKIGNAWGVMYPNTDREYEYHVAYQEKRGFEVIEKHRVEFPFSIYVDPYVYLVRQISE